MSVHRFSWASFSLRLLFALVLVFATYNPENFSYYHWAIAPLLGGGDASLTVLHLFLGVVLLIGWVIFLRATMRALGAIGLVLAVAFFGTLLWLVVDYGLVSAENSRALSYLVLLGLAGVLSTGLSWSHIRRRLTGQLDVDETDD